jgi:hypothetical protein
MTLGHPLKLAGLDSQNSAASIRQIFARIIAHASWPQILRFLHSLGQLRRSDHAVTESGALPIATVSCSAIGLALE